MKVLSIIKGSREREGRRRREGDRKGDTGERVRIITQGGRVEKCQG